MDAQKQMQVGLVQNSGSPIPRRRSAGFRAVALVLGSTFLAATLVTSLVDAASAEEGEGSSAGAPAVQNLAFNSVDDPAKDYTIVAELEVGDNPRDVAFSPDGSRLYVANDGIWSGSASLRPGSLSVIDMSDGTVEEIAIPETEHAFQVHPTPDGSQVWVLTHANGRQAPWIYSGITVLDATDFSVLSTFTVSNQVAPLEFSPDGSLAYVSSGEEMRVVDVATHAIRTTYNPRRHGYIQLHDSALSVDGAVLYVILRDDKGSSIKQLDALTLVELEGDWPEPEIEMSFRLRHASQGAVLTAVVNTAAHVFDANPQSETFMQPLNPGFPATRNPRGFEHANDGSLTFFADASSGSLRVHRLLPALQANVHVLSGFSTGNPGEGYPSVTGYPGELALSPDGTRLAVTTSASERHMPTSVTPRFISIVQLPATADAAPSFAQDESSSTGTKTDPYLYRFYAGGFPTPTYTSVGDLPPGLSLSSRGVLRGTPTQAGEWDFVVRATNGVGDVVENRHRVSIDERPDAVEDLLLSSGFGQVVVSWSASPLADSYRVEAVHTEWVENSPNIVTNLSCDTAGLQCIFGDLTPGQVRVSVYAVNNAGDSPASTGSTQSQAVIAPTELPQPIGVVSVELLDENGDALTVVDPGQEVEIVTHGFTPGSSVEVFIYSTPAHVIGALSDSLGVARATGFIPSGLTLGSSHTVVAIGIDPVGAQAVATYAVSVSPPVPTTPVVPVVSPVPVSPPAPPVAGGGELSATGLEAAPYVTIAVALVLLGATAIAASARGRLRSSRGLSA